MATDFDVIICGAGPAGCTAALALGSSGLKVALIEKERLPGEKVCGDAVPPFVPKVLNTINPEYASAFEGIIEKNKVNACRITAPASHTLGLKFPEYGFVCKRKIFDAFLFELAGHLPNLTIFQDTAVNNASVNSNEVVVDTDNNLSLRAQVVIGCDGANSIIRKKLADEKINKAECSVGVRAYFKNISGTSPGTLEFHFLKDFLPGYFWIFPLPENQFNVGLGMPSKIISQKNINLRKEMLRIIETFPDLSRRFSEAEIISKIKGHLLTNCSRKIPISGKRFMLCGDAASLVNPATGAGIGQAMQSGRYAGWHTLRCFEKNDFSGDLMKCYDKTVYDKLWHTNKQYLMIRKYVIKYPGILNAIIKTGSTSKFINRTIMKNIK